MADEWDDPAAPSGGIDWNALAGRLLLIQVYNVEQGINTTFGVKDAVRADVTVLDGPTAGELKANTLIFPGVLIGQLKTKVGRNVLGRLGYGQAKAGQRPPWKLDTATDADRRIADSFRSNSKVTTDTWSSPGIASPPQGGNPPF